MLTLKIFKRTYRNLKIDLIYTIYPECFCDKNLESFFLFLTPRLCCALWQDSYVSSVSEQSVSPTRGAPTHALNHHTDLNCAMTWNSDWNREQGTELNPIDLTIFCRNKAAKQSKSGQKSFEIFLHLFFTYLVQRSIAFARNAYNRGINTAKRSRFSGVTTMFTVMRTLMCASIYGVLGFQQWRCGRTLREEPTIYTPMPQSGPQFRSSSYNVQCRVYIDCTTQIVHCPQ